MEARCLIGVFKKISKDLDKKLKKKLSDENLHVLVSHIILFYILPDNGDVMPFNELTGKWEISKSSLSDILKRYEEQDMICRKACSYDKRVVNFGLTTKGKEVKDKLVIIEDKLLHELMKDLNKEEKILLETMLRRII